jgi:hypothetical protein
MTAPFGPVAGAFNRAVRATAIDNVPARYRRMAPPPQAGATNTYDAEYEVTYLDRRLASVVFTISTFTGGAHPNHERRSLLFDIARGRALGLGDLITNPRQALPMLARACRAQLEADARESQWQLFEHADIPAVVRDVKNWSVDKDAVTVMFDPYAVAAYVTGTHECRLSYGELAPFLQPGGPLPPR